MKRHADLTKRAHVAASDLPWVASPMAGVERRMLERDGDEVARATSLVRYAPGSRFSAHRHDGGEEFIVLSGVFSDETGDFPAGSYVRNPVGSAHVPYSEPGCIIFVKLWQMPAEDQLYVRSSLNDSSRLEPTGEGERMHLLHATPHEQVALVALAPGAELREVFFPGGVEYFVLSGSFSDAAGTYQACDWLRLPCGSRHTIRSAEGCRLYRKTGHLAAPPPFPA